MTVWIDDRQKERNIHDESVWYGKSEEPAKPGYPFYFGIHGIRWKILKINQKQKRMLVIAEDNVCDRKFHDTYEKCTWETSSLRKWLNTSFLNNEFTKEELSAVLMTHLSKTQNPHYNRDSGKETYDRIFLLSVEEFRQYMRILKKEKGSETWWLRTVGYNNTLIVNTKNMGETDYYGCSCRMDLGVRPAMWIDLNADPVRSRFVINSNKERCVVNPELIVEKGTLVYGSSFCRNVELPVSVKKIRYHAFQHCPELERITWTGKSPVIEGKAFVDCPRLVLPSAFYMGERLPSDSLWSYMPDDPKLMVELLMNSNGTGPYWEGFIRLLSPYNAEEIADAVLERFRGIRDPNACERLLRFALAASAVLGKERLVTIQKTLRSAGYSAFQWQPLLQREIEQCIPMKIIAKAILNKKTVSVDILRSEWRELDRLPSFAAVMYAVGAYAEENETCEKHPEAAKLAAEMNHNALMGLLRKWAEWINVRWYAPYTVYANDQELAVLLEEMKGWAKKKAARERVVSVNEAVLLNDTVTAQRYADQMGWLGTYAKIRNMDEDDIRDNSISDFGLDETGKRTWVLAGKTLTACVKKDLTVTLTDETGKKYKDMPEIGEDLGTYLRADLEYKDLKDSIIPTAKLRNDHIFADFLSGRKRDAGSWKKGYLQKAVLRIMAKLIVWDQDGSTFTLDERGQAVTAENKPYAITDVPIAVAHPIEMGKEVTEVWQRYFTERKLKQPFEQVWEPVEAPEDVKPGRYDDCEMSIQMLRNKEKHGIYLEGTKHIKLKECHGKLTRASLYSGCSDENYTIADFHYDAWSRQVNHIVTYLDKCTVAGRIRKDDITAVQWFDRFTLAQITAFIDMANKAQAHNVLAQLLEYRNTHFGGFDPMKEFTLDL